MSQQYSAGSFAQWLEETQAVILETADADVPCGSCNACCRSAQFILITPDDQAAKAAIAKELLFPAPGKPEHWVMGFDENGHCPMLKNDACSIYADRPITCRAYDCRIFAAAKLSAGGTERMDVNTRAQAWVFDFANTEDTDRAKAIAHAAEYLQTNPIEELSDNPIQIALAAIRIHELFVGSTATVCADNLQDRIRAVLLP